MANRIADSLGTRNRITNRSRTYQPQLLARVKSQPWAQVPVVWEEPVHRGHGHDEQRSYKIVTVARGLARCPRGPDVPMPPPVVHEGLR